MIRAPRFVLSALLAGSSLYALGCGSPAPSGPVGGPVMGAADDHCAVNGTLMPVKVGMCVAEGSTDAAASTDDAGDDAGGEAGAPVSEVGDPRFNSESYDDDCKYHVSFTSTPIRKNEPVTFTLTVVGLDPARPATGADAYTEIYLTEFVVAPNTHSTTTETPPGSGVYKIGPVKFNVSGRWTVRFHLYGNCADAPPDSPHGHAAFYIDVP